MCKDRQSECPDGTTCCIESSGAYSCCPETNGVCCPDKIHCCPKGYKCDDKIQKCERGDTTISFLTKLPALKAPENVICPDQKSECPTGNTCCLTSEGIYGCCPKPNAVCCSDKVHCCPSGYTCEKNSGMCKKDDEMIPSYEKLPALNAPENIICHGGKFACPNNNTCCNKTGEVVGCCPMAEAVCCPDKIHCCPKDFTCANKTGTCYKAGTTIPFLTQLQAMNTPEIVCPDGGECPSGNTCCEQGGGDYGCCSYSNAVCCPDKVSCCPEGSKCGATYCWKGDEAIPFLMQLQAVNTPEIVCPDGGKCPSGNTCCETGDGTYGCCPQPNAVCCPDKVHCCPEGSKCGATYCEKGDEAIPFLTKLQAVTNTPENVDCPDGKSECANGQTCCMTKSGNYGCCPQSNAVCCPDKVHCCPEGSKCGATYCEKGDEAIPFLNRLPAMNTPENVDCPDGKSECANGQTCCKEKSGIYGCCPESHGVCCPDMIHCCPGGYKCNDATGKCEPGYEAIPFLTQLQAMNTPEIVCPDGGKCPSGNTCCETGDGTYGCCPQPNAVCCPDKVHCCPEGSKCGATYCEKGDEAIPFLTKLQAVTNTPENVICPDGKSECANGQTCCMTKSGNYGCCPQSNAVCCPDKVHCCPGGYKCNDATGKCEPGYEAIPFLNRLPAMNTPITEAAPKNVKCPGDGECPDKNTCCETSTGIYGCCPKANAVCCPDKMHCCPNGYICHDSDEKCLKKATSVPFLDEPDTLENVPMTLSKEQDPALDTCPDQQSVCPDGDTCCKAEGRTDYNCCPESHAVCCKVGPLCCPSGYTCDGENQRCIRGTESVPFIKRNPSTSISLPFVDLQVQKQRVNDVCPDSHKNCNTGETCCIVKSGGYGCCHFSNAVCCSDKVHCCPESFECDVTRGICTSSGKGVPFFQKLNVVSTPETTPPSDVVTVTQLKLKEDESSPESINCPDKSKCPDSTTCCQTQDNTYGCCKHPQAQCCTDKVHCCPKGYICDPDNMNCKANGSSVPFITMQATHKDMTPLTLTTTPKVVDCPDGSVCEAGQTCCESTSGEYGCCPVPNAVCCSDEKHCCPNGYTCETSIGKCRKDDSELAFLKKLPTLKAPKDVDCPDGSVCEAGQTCCKSTSAKYGCCPVPNAVCCSDEKHCCPSGYTCETSIGRCKRGDLEMAFLEKLPKLKSSQNVICPDQQSECQDKQTCCKDYRGEMSCCTIENAVCCSDGKHCCPEGFKCDTDQAICTKSAKNLFSLMQKQPSTSNSVICPDGSSCPPGNTCCPQSSGQYGCCPHLYATCCSDKYCCPEFEICKIPYCESIRTKTPAIIMDPQDVVCPDGKTSCPNQNTCCPLAVGGYACCKAAQATCCDDEIHCCPHGYKCEPGSNKCTRNLDAILAMFLTPPPTKPSQTEQTSNKLKDSICSDREHWCPDKTTCCAWGCCPSVNAVCCGEMEHCCSAGFTCGSNKSCILEMPIVRHATTVATKQTLPRDPNVECPDKSQCGANNTCCKTKSITYGCCPAKDGVCCADLVHCCPSGTTCDTHGGKCRPLPGISSYEEASELLKIRSIKFDESVQDNQFL